MFDPTTYKSRLYPWIQPTKIGCIIPNIDSQLQLQLQLHYIIFCIHGNKSTTKKTLKIPTKSHIWTLWSLAIQWAKKQKVTSPLIRLCRSKSSTSPNKINSIFQNQTSASSCNASSFADCFNLSAAFTTSESQFVLAVIISRVIVCSTTPTIIPHQIPWKKKKRSIYQCHFLAVMQRERERGVEVRLQSSFEFSSPVQFSAFLRWSIPDPQRWSGTVHIVDLAEKNLHEKSTRSNTDSYPNKSHLQGKIDGGRKNGYKCDLAMELSMSDQANYFDMDILLARDQWDERFWSYLRAVKEPKKCWKLDETGGLEAERAAEARARDGFVLTAAAKLVLKPRTHPMGRPMT